GLVERKVGCEGGAAKANPGVVHDHGVDFRLLFVSGFLGMLWDTLHPTGERVLGICVQRFRDSLAVGREAPKGASRARRNWGMFWLRPITLMRRARLPRFSSMTM